ncbi:anti-sigma factor [Phycisphaerales bacterium AB-hyl4]|uniref:Anti-sigma factor n=1 Tax=Natronomicrosphaera hydrolytica TaxID=3242702 RepID=A0ABV4U638_9BACT
MADRYDPETLLAYIEGDLSDDARARFEAKLADDAELRRLVAGLKRDRAAMRDLPSEPPPTGMVDDVMQQLERQMLLGSPSDEPIPIESAKRPPRRHRVYKGLAYSGIAAIMLLSGGLILYTLTGTDAIETAQRLVQLGQTQESARDVADGRDVPAAVESGERADLSDRPMASPGDLTMADRDESLLDAPTTLAERAPTAMRAEALAMEREAAAELRPQPESMTLEADELVRPWEQDGTLASRLRLNDGLRLDRPLEGTGEAMVTRDVDAFDVTAMPSVSEPPPLTLGHRASALPRELYELSIGWDADAVDVAEAVEVGDAEVTLADDAAESQRIQVKVVSADVARTHAELSQWAAEQGSAVAMHTGTTTAYTRGLDASRDDGPATMRTQAQEADAVGDEHVAMTSPTRVQVGEQVGRMHLEGRQLPELLAYLNREDGQQRAELVFGGGEGIMHLPPTSLALDELAEWSTLRPPMQQASQVRTWMDIDVVILPLDGDVADEAVDALPDALLEELPDDAPDE